MLCRLICWAAILLGLTSCVGENGSPAQDTFKDCDACPLMVIVPAGEFIMGAPDSEKGLESERPQHRVAIAQDFAVSQFEITFDEWDACAADNVCRTGIDDEGFGRGKRPVMNLLIDDAETYVGWLSRKTGKPYRLLSEAEWEYAARAGSSTAYPWGDEMTSGKARCRGCENKDGQRQTLPGGAFPPNAFGLYDMHGNVSEYVADCWHDTYDGAPNDGSVWQGGDCGKRILRGGAWRSIAWVLRSGARFKRDADDATDLSGLRVARPAP